MNPADLLQRVLTDVADAIPHEPTSPEAIRVAADRERRRSRQVAGLGALAAALVVAAPVALLQQGDGDPAPVEPPTTAPVDPGDDEPRGLEALPLGQPPRVAWLDVDVLATPGGERIPLDQHRAASAVPVDDGVVVTDDQWFEGTVGLTWRDAQGRVREQWPSTGPAVVGSLGDVAWASVHPPEVGRPGHHAIWVWSDGNLAEFPIGGTQPMPVLAGFLGRAVVYHGWAEAGVSVYEPGIGDRRIELLGTAADTDERHGWIAGQLVTSPQHGVIVDGSGELVRSFPGWTLLTFSPDGSLLVAAPNDGGRGLTVFETATGQVAATLLDDGSRLGWTDVAWEDADHVIVEVQRGERGALVRAGLDGSLERVTPVGRWDDFEIAAP